MIFIIMILFVKGANFGRKEYEDRIQENVMKELLNKDSKQICKKMMALIK